MNRKMIAIALGAATLLLASAAQARVDVNVDLGVPLFYSPPPPVVYSPPVYYRAPPPPVVYYGRGYWSDDHRRDRGYDRRREDHRDHRDDRHDR